LNIDGFAVAPSIMRWNSGRRLSVAEAPERYNTCSADAFDDITLELLDDEARGLFLLKAGLGVPMQAMASAAERRGLPVGSHVSHVSKSFRVRLPPQMMTATRLPRKVSGRAHDCSDTSRVGRLGEKAGFVEQEPHGGDNGQVIHQLHVVDEALHIRHRFCDRYTHPDAVSDGRDRRRGR
jgi:hypothetical protein